MPMIPPFMNTMGANDPDTTTTLPSATHPDNPVSSTYAAHPANSYGADIAGVQPPVPAGPTPGALSNDGVVNMEMLRRDRQRTEAKYKTHDPESKAEEDKGLKGAVKHAGEALSKSMGGGGGK